MHRASVKTIGSLALAGLLLAGGSAANAASVALTFSGGVAGGSAQTRGWSFSTANSIAVTSLGWWDESGDGLLSSHQVAIWDLAGNLLMSATVAAGTADPLLSGFRFDSSLSGTTLLAAGTYVIAGLAAGADLLASAATGLTLASGISFIANRTNGVVNSFSFPGATQAGLDPGLFGPSFQFDPAGVVSEPSGLALAGAALAALAWIRRGRPGSSGRGATDPA